MNKENFNNRVKPAAQVPESSLISKINFEQHRIELLLILNVNFQDAAECFKFKYKVLQQMIFCTICVVGFGFIRTKNIHSIRIHSTLEIKLLQLALNVRSVIS
jgi:hypothetical protein